MFDTNRQPAGGCLAPSFNIPLKFRKILSIQFAQHWVVMRWNIPLDLCGIYAKRIFRYSAER